MFSQDRELTMKTRFPLAVVLFLSKTFQSFTLDCNVTGEAAKARLEQVKFDDFFKGITFDQFYRHNVSNMQYFGKTSRCINYDRAYLVRFVTSYNSSFMRFLDYTAGSCTDYQMFKDEEGYLRVWLHSKFPAQAGEVIVGFYTDHIIHKRVYFKSEVDMIDFLEFLLVNVTLSRQEFSAQNDSLAQECFNLPNVTAKLRNGNSRSNSQNELIVFFALMKILMDSVTLFLN